MARQNIGYGSSANDGTGDYIRDALAKTNDNFIELYAASPATLRGCLVTKAADQTAANYTSATYVAWDSESYDTDSIHSNVTNNSRLTVPSGVATVRLSGQINIDLHTANRYVFVGIDKNGSATAYPGQAVQGSMISGTFPSVNLTTPALSVTPGDYFQLRLTVEFDTSITIIKDSSWFAMQIIG